MKKQLTLAVLFAVFVLMPVVGNKTADLNSIDGLVSVQYVGKDWSDADCSIYVEDIYNSILEQLWVCVGHCEKMSKSENALLWDGLWQYDLEKGEVYLVVVQEGSVLERDTILVLLVEITDTGDDPKCVWWDIGYFEEE